MSITSRINEMSTHIGQAYDELQGLGADLTNVNKNIENISSVLDDIYDSLPSVSGEGTSLTLDDTRVGKIKSTLKGNTSQDGTPTPSSPIPVNVVSGDNEIVVCGENLLPDEWTSGSISGSTGQVVNYGSRIYTTNKIILDGNTTYCFKHNNTSTWSIRASIDEYDKDNNHLGRIGGLNGSVNGEFTTQSNTKYINITIIEATDTITYAEYQTLLSNGKLQPMLNVGSSASTYEPYQGNTYNIDLGVKNLWNSEDMKIGYLNQSGSYPVTNSSYPNARYIIVPLYKGQSLTTYSQYTYSAFRMRYIDIETNQIVGTVGVGTNNGYCTSAVTYQGEWSNGTVTATKDILLGFFDFDGYMSTSGDFQITYGTKIQTISPTPIELCSSPDGTKRNYLLHDKTLDKWYWHREIKKVVFNGTEEWELQSINTYGIANFQLPLGDYIGGSDNRGASCDHFTKQTSLISQTQIEGFFINFSNTLFIRINSTTANTKDIFKTWLSTNNTILYYALATPTNTEITYQPLIDQLNAIEQAQSKENQTNISQVNNDLPFIISASALKEWSV